MKGGRGPGTSLCWNRLKVATLALGSALAITSTRGAQIEARTAATPILGEPASIALVVDQFPVGMTGEDFPLIGLQLLAEKYLRERGIAVVPRATRKAEQSYLHVSVVAIQLRAGFVYLVECDLRERVPAACTGGPALEISSWQHRQWINAPSGGPPSSQQAWSTVKQALDAYIRRKQQVVR